MQGVVFGSWLNPACDEGIEGSLLKPQWDSSRRTKLGVNNGLEGEAHLDLVPLLLLGCSVQHAAIRRTFSASSIGHDGVASAYERRQLCTTARPSWLSAMAAGERPALSQPAQVAVGLLNQRCGKKVAERDSDRSTIATIVRAVLNGAKTAPDGGWYPTEFDTAGTIGARRHIPARRRHLGNIRSAAGALAAGALAAGALALRERHVLKTV